jgi:hypothetical protein
MKSIYNEIYHVNTYFRYERIRFVSGIQKDNSTIILIWWKEVYAK